MFLELIAEVDDNGNGELEFDEFLMVLKNQQSRNSYCSSIKYALMFGPKQIHTIRKQFQQLDTDGSGEIDEEELSALIKQLGYRVKDFNLQEIIAEVDDDRNGTINFAEVATYFIWCFEQIHLVFAYCIQYAPREKFKYVFQHLIVLYELHQCRIQ